mgnify:CR=1 FL=1
MLTIQDRQRVYNRLIELGMPELYAAPMAEQADALGYYELMKEKKLLNCVFYFLEWDKTKEGMEFWAELSSDMNKRKVR